MSTIQSQLRAAYTDATSRPADETQNMLDIYNLAGFIDSTLLNCTLIEDDITAGAGGGQSNAVALSATKFVHRVATVTSGNDSVSLPAAVVGVRPHVVVNAAANSLQVFGLSTDTINDVSAATGVAQTTTKCAIYFCTTAGKWYRILTG